VASAVSTLPLLALPNQEAPPSARPTDWSQRSLQRAGGGGARKASVRPRSNRCGILANGADCSERSEPTSAGATSSEALPVANGVCTLPLLELAGPEATPSARPGGRSLRALQAAPESRVLGRHRPA